MQENEKEFVSISGIEALLKKTTELLEIISKGLNSRLERVVKKTWILANIVICIQVTLVVFAALEYKSAKKFNKIQIEKTEGYEKTKNAIEAINKIYNSEFINSLAKLKGNKTLKNIEMTNALNLVFNTYYVIAIIYKSDIADNQIIKESIKEEIIEFMELPVVLSDTSQTKNEIQKMINNFKKEDL